MLKKILKMTVIACLTANAYAVEKAMESKIEQVIELHAGCWGSNIEGNTIYNLKLRRNTKLNDYTYLEEVSIMNKRHEGKGEIVFDSLLKFINDEEIRKSLKDKCVAEIARPRKEGDEIIITSEADEIRLKNILLPALGGFEVSSVTSEKQLNYGKHRLNPLKHLTINTFSEMRPGNRVYVKPHLNRIVFINPNYSETSDNDKDIKQIKQFNFSFEFSFKESDWYLREETPYGPKQIFYGKTFKIFQEIEKFIAENPTVNTKKVFNTLVYFAKIKKTAAPYESYKEGIQTIQQQGKGSIFHIKDENNIINEEHEAYKLLNEIFQSERLEYNVSYQ